MCKTKADNSGNGSEQASDPTASESGQETEAKAKRTRVYRGQTCEITRTTKNTRTGAIYDLIAYRRGVTNRRTGDVTEAIVGVKLRRPGTGVEPTTDEVEVEE